LLLHLIPVIHPLWRSLMFCYQNVIKVLLSTEYYGLLKSNRGYLRLNL